MEQMDGLKTAGEIRKIDEEKLQQEVEIGGILLSHWKSILYIIT